MSQSHHTIPVLDRKGLRNFGLSTGAVLAVLFGLVIPWLFSLNYPKWPWIIGGVLIALGLVVPDILRPVYNVWMRIGLVLNRITTPIIMGILFFLVVFPMGFVMRMVRKDPMNRTMDDAAESYRVPSKAAQPEDLERPF